MSYVLSIDPGFVQDPTGFVLAHVTVPAVVVARDGTLVDVHTSATVELPEGVTAADFVLPRYDVVDVQRRRALTFARTVGEAVAVARDLGDLEVVCDATGLGRGLVESVRRAGLRCHAVTLTGGERPSSRGPTETSMPVVWAFAKLYEVLATGRMRVAAGVAEDLCEELKSLEHETTADGRLRIEGGGSDHHADTAFSAAMLTGVVDRRHGRTSRAVLAATRDGGRRPSSEPRPRSGNRIRTRSIGRSVIEERKEASRRRAMADLWSPIRGGP